MPKLAFVIILVCFFIGCTKDISTEDRITAQSSGWSSDSIQTSLLFKELDPLKPAPIIDSFDAAFGALLKVGDSVEVEFGANQFLTNSYGSGGSDSIKPLTGKVKVELLQLRTVADHISFLKPTETNEQRINSNGTLRVHVKKELQPVYLRYDSTYTVRYKFQNPSTGNLVFRGDTNVNNSIRFEWRKTEIARKNKVEIWQSTQSGAIGYALKTQYFGWLAGAQYADTGSSKITIESVNKELGKNNSLVFAVIKGERSLVQCKPDSLQKIFELKSLKANQQVKIVWISRWKDQYWYAERSAIAGVDKGIQVEPLQISISNLIAALRNLTW